MQGTPGGKLRRTRKIGGPKRIRRREERERKQTVRQYLMVDKEISVIEGDTELTTGKKCIHSPSPRKSMILFRSYQHQASIGVGE